VSVINTVTDFFVKKIKANVGRCKKYSQ